MADGAIHVISFFISVKEVFITKELLGTIPTQDNKAKGE